MSVTAYPTLRLKLTMPQALKLQFLPAVPGSNAQAAADAAAASADAAAAAAADAANKVNRAGDTMTGFLTLNANPTANLHAVTKQYVDARPTGDGNVSNSGTPVLDQLAQWTDATHIKGLTIGATLSTTGGELNTTAGGGNVMAVNSPAAGQFAQWTSPVQIQGRTATQTTALLDVFTSTLKGLAPSSGGGTANFLRADGSWAAPPGGGGAPVSAEYITSTADATLSAERVLTDTATVTWDRTVAGQIKANAAGGGTGNVTYTASSTAPVSPAAGDLWYDLSTGVLSIRVNDGTSSQWVMVAPPGGGSSSDPTPPQGRLTLLTATPVMTTTQSAKTTIYYTPYVGNKVPIYDGTNMVMTTFAELSVATTDTTKSPAAIGVAKVNDWLIWNDAGTIRLGHGPDWTSDTVRSAGTALVMVNGIWLNNAAITNGPAAQRGTYVGTTRSNASSQLDWIYGAFATNWSAAFFGLWNCYNRTNVATLLGDTTSSWTYASPTWRAPNGNTNTARVSYVCGFAEDAVDALWISVAVKTASGEPAIAIGIDTTSSPSGIITETNGTTTLPLVACYSGFPGLGFHFISALEYATAATAAFYGTAGIGYLQTGMRFNLKA